MTGPPSEFNRHEPDPALTALLADFPADLFSERLYRSIHWAEDYVLALTVEVLRQLGLDERKQEPASAAGLCCAHDLDPSQASRLAWLLERATAAGLVTATDDGGPRTYQVTAPLVSPAIARLAADGLSIDPGNRPTLALLDAAAAAIHGLREGAVGRKTALLGAEAVGLWLDYFNNANLLYAANNRLAAIAAVSQLSGKSRFSILEVGAGAGSGAEALLDELDRRDLQGRLDRYLITEPGTFFRRRGERHLKQRSRQLPLSFASLDIDQPWAEQKLEDERFDLIFGVNVFHVAKNLTSSLSEARRRLSGDGVLVAGECLRPDPRTACYIEFVFQLLDSYHQAELDPPRRARPGFLTPEEWSLALSASGFSQVTLLPDHRQTRTIFPQLFIGALCGR
ncbi:MAG: methyltransferase [Rhodospirillales bacterium]|nr:methyltransferase [Rhodospirillales bacterium]